MKKWLLYGANGYSGRLIAEQSKKLGIFPVLAGRSPSVQALAMKLGLEYRVFGLDNINEAAEYLEECELVLNCAGPFSATAMPILDACLKAKVHYLDITGEIDVFEAVFARDAELKKAGVTAVPGVGFDVVPSDCLAALLKHRMPGARRLHLGMKTESLTSPGTTRTMIESLHKGNRVRFEGKLVAAPHGKLTRKIKFKDHEESCVAIPWGDVSTAYYSTGIPEIAVFTAMPPLMGYVARWLGMATEIAPVRRLLMTALGKMAKGPDEQEFQDGKTLLWGEVTDGVGKTLELRLVTPNGYKHTVDAALACVKRVLESPSTLSAGALTPSMAFGADFVLSLPDVKLT